MNKSLLIIFCAFFIACSESVTNKESTIQFKVIKSAALKDDIISLKISDHNYNWDVLGKLDTNSFVGSTAWQSNKYQTLNNGSIIIEFKLKTASGKIISQGDISIPLKEDWAWSVEFWNLSINPINGCFGCYGSKSYPIVDSAYITENVDSIYIVYGGNSISHPVIY